MKSHYSSAGALGVEACSLRAFIAVLAVLFICLLIALRILPSVGASALLLGGSGAGFLLVGRRSERDVLHPVRVFGALWCVCLALSSMRLLPLISEWGSRTWLCVLTPLVSFPFGFWLATRALRREKNDPRPPFRDEIAIIAQHRGVVAALLCLIVGLAVLTYEYRLIGGIPILSENPDAARMKLFGVAGQVDAPEFGGMLIKIIHPLVEFNKYAIFLALLVLIQKGRKSRRTVFCAVLTIAVGTLAFISQGGRIFLVEIAIVCAALVHYLARSVRLRDLSVGVVLLFLFIALYGGSRIEKSESAPLFGRALNGSSFPEGSFWQGVAFGYATVTVSFEVFNRLIEDLQNMRRPAEGFLFYSLHRFLPRANIQEFSLGLYGGESITPTFLGEFYADYGYLGVLLGPFALGFVYGWVYLQGISSVNWVYARALFLQLLVFFPYVNLFSQYLTWIFDLFFMYWLLHWACPQRRELDVVVAGAAGARALSQSVA